jgi:glyoxylase-like metal-dependent hydrolase (beta-lactamase superfamily II)
MSDDGAGDSEIVRKTRARNRVNLAPYRERLRLLRDGEEVLGCTALCAPGHSPGHTCWRIAAGGEALLAWGDLVHLSRIQIRHPEAALSYDLDKELAKQSRRRVLDMAASEGLMIAGAHVDAPGLGHVVRKGATFDLERV